MTDEFTPLHRGGSGPPLVCLHGFTATWRAWDLVLPALERRHDVLAVTLAGHAGGPPLGDDIGGDALADLAEHARTDGWPLDPSRVACPVRSVWGTADRLLPWPSAAARFREGWFPHADWIELDGVGHCPQLDVPLETAELILGFTR